MRTTLTALLALALTTPAAAQDPPAVMPPLAVEDPDVTPAQFTVPVGPPAPAAPQPARSLGDPPSPVVRIQVRVPADAPPGDDLKYVITVQNVSQAEAHHVQVRNPVNETAPPQKAEPKWDEKQPDPKQLVWSFGTLKPGATKTIELYLKPKAGATEVKNLAYVKFEHGEATTTKINRPGLKVAKVAPKQIVRDEPYLVRVMVENNGKVPAESVRVVENVDRAAEVEAITTGAKRTKQDENQWQWEIGTLMPGQRKVIEYRVTPRNTSDSLTTSAVSAAKEVLEKAESRTQVLVPELKAKLNCLTPGLVQPGQAAVYEIEVRNTGTLPSTNIRVSGTIPSDCTPSKMTNGGKVFRDQVVWTVARLEPGEAQSFRFGLKANTTGRRTVVASASDARGMKTSEELSTTFQGTASLNWETKPEPVTLAVGARGTFTVRVKNGGGEAATNVRVEVELPDAVKLVQGTATNRVLSFPPETIAGYGEKTYTITYEAVKPDQAWFKFKMTADALGSGPLTTEKAVQITGPAR